MEPTRETLNLHFGETRVTRDEVVNHSLTEWSDLQRVANTAHEFRVNERFDDIRRLALGADAELDEEMAS